jgi:5-methylcytosine-specific restriction endonuclease McrA
MLQGILIQNKMSKHKEIKDRVFYANGIYKQVLEEILSAQKSNIDRVFYLQPYSFEIINELRDLTSEAGYKWKLYASITEDLNHIHYVADIVGWENKQELSSSRLDFLNEHIFTFQPKEKSIYTDKGINLISIINLKKLSQPIPVNQCFKISDGSQLKPRTQAGRWSYLFPLQKLESIEFTLKSFIDKEFDSHVKKSLKESYALRNKRLENAPKIPEKILTVSTGYKRNPDVVAFILTRANGSCELCKQKAPFLKASDKSGYLEVHHWKPLSEGGEDTIANAVALCPNCHKEAHFGVNKDKIKLEHINL